MSRFHRRGAGPDVPANPRELPNYRLREAAHYLRVPLSTLRWWLFGRRYPTRGGPVQARPVIIAPESDPPMLSFVNLVEAHVLEAIRHRYLVPLPRVRQAVDYVRERFKIDHPLADARFETDGVDLFVREFGRLVNATREGQLEMAELLRAHVRRIDHDPAGSPLRLYLFTRNRHADEPRAVVVDPRVSFGRPVIAGTGIATANVAQRYKAGESIDELARDYDRTRTEIEEALRCELDVAA